MSAERPMSDLGKALLASMADDRPSTDGRRRAALALGIAAAAAPATATSAPPAPAAPVVHPYLAWAAGAVAAIAIATVPYLRTAPPATTPVAPVAPVAAPAEAAPPVVAPAEAVTAPVADAPRSPARPKRAHRVATPAVADAVAPAPSAAPVAAGLSSLSVETTLLDAARAALRQHASHAALELLRRYDEEVPAGVLRAEADALRVEATLANGDRDEAARLAARFFATHHDSALTAHVRALLQK